MSDQEITLSPPMSVDTSTFALLADLQYLEPFASEALNRKFYGVIPPGIYRGFQYVLPGSMKLRIGRPSEAGTAIIHVGDRCITVQQYKPVDLVVAAGFVGRVVLEGFYQFGVKTKQVDSESTVDAVSIKLVTEAQYKPEHVTLYNLNVPANATAMQDSYISDAKRDDVDIAVDSSIYRDLAAHIASPTAHTKAQVGLSNVNNWPATAAVNDSSDAKYATAGAVKRAYDLAASKLDSSANAVSATKLATARQINGTNFDGTANITTANWGTARTLTIGNTAKSVNGGGNVAWSLAEIGAARARGELASGSTENITTAQFVQWLKDSGAFNERVWIARGSWSYASNKTITDTGCGNIHLSGCTIEVISGSELAYTIRIITPTTTSGGGTTGAEFVYVNNGSAYSPGWRRIYTTAWKPNADDVGALPSGGTAVAATKLATARQINGTNFDGTGNITTANWGTARTLTIGSTGKSVNGAGNVAWSLAEIGALGKTETAANSLRVGDTNLNTTNTTFIAPPSLNWWGDCGVGHSQMVKNGEGWALGNGFVFKMGARDAGKGHAWLGMTSYTNGGNLVFGAAESGSTAPQWATVYSTRNKPTSTDVGLGNVNNWPATAAVNDPSDVKYATAGAVKKAYDLAASKLDSSANAVSATKLATPRQINGTNFDGTANITTANWGTARTLTIGNSGKSVNGGGNVSWSLAEIGAAEVLNKAIVIPAISGTSGATLKTQKDNAGGADDKETWLTDKPTSVTTHKAIGIKTTLGPVYWNGTTSRRIYNEDFKPTASDVGLGNANNTADSAKNVLSATKLTTPRQINGTNFDGTANITTANWGTARTLTIGNTAKSVNGGGNVAWSLTEIGAAPEGHGLGTYAGGVSNTTTDLRTKSGFYNASGATGEPVGGHTWKYYFNAAHSNAAGYNGTIAMDFDGGVLAFRAISGGADRGWKYVYHSGNKPSAADVGLGSVNNTADSAKNVLSATKLATPRQINGTNFDGTANITTANWGTARTLTIGSTGKAVNGAGNVSWTLAEIGALPLTGGTLTGGLTFSMDSELGWVRNTDYAKIGFKNTADNDTDSYMWFKTGDNGNEYFKWQGVSGSTTTDWMTLKSSGLAVAGTITAPTFSGALSGNAATATKLATARTLTIGKTGKAFDGTANVAWSLAEMGAAEVAAGMIVIPALSGTSSATLKTQKDNSGGVDDKETWMTDKPTTASGHKGIGIKTTVGPVYWNGTAQRRIYNEDFKPTAADVGALPSSGTAADSAKLNGQTADYYNGGRYLGRIAHNMRPTQYKTNGTGTSVIGGYSNGAPTNYGETLHIQGSTNGAAQIYVDWSTGPSGTSETPSGTQGGVWVRACRDNGDTWTNWARVYTTHYKPTAADVKAVGVRGSHASDWTSAPAMAGKTYAGGYHHNVAESAYLSFGASGTSAKMDIFIDGEYYANDGTKRVYHEGFKPTASDVGLGNVPNMAHNIEAQVSTVPIRDGSGDIKARLFRSNYGGESGIASSAGIAFRNSTSDDYVRFCTSPAAIRGWLGLSAVENKAWVRVASGACNLNLANGRDVYVGRFSTGVAFAGRTFDQGRYRIVMKTTGSVSTGNADALWWSVRGEILPVQYWSKTSLHVEVYCSGGDIQSGKVDQWELYEWK